MSCAGVWLMAGGSVLATAVVRRRVVCLGAAAARWATYAQAGRPHRPAAALATGRRLAARRQHAGAAGERLQLRQRLRDFAVNELKLPDNASYRRYGRPAAQRPRCDVVAAPRCRDAQDLVFPGRRLRRLTAATSVRRRRDAGRAVAGRGWKSASTRARLFDVGWSNWIGGRPRWLNTFIQWPEGELGAHDLPRTGHQVAYATTTRPSTNPSPPRWTHRRPRWLDRHASRRRGPNTPALETRRQDFRALVLKTRQELEGVYASACPTPQARAQGRGTGRHARRVRCAESRALGRLCGYDGWFERANNAALGVQAAYHELVPAFERLFESSGGDFQRFYAEVQRLAVLPKDEAPRQTRRITLNERNPPWPTSASTVTTNWAWRRRARWPGPGPNRWSRSSTWLVP